MSQQNHLDQAEEEPEDGAILDHQQLLAQGEQLFLQGHLAGLPGSTNTNNMQQGNAAQQGNGMGDAGAPAGYAGLQHIQYEFSEDESGGDGPPNLLPSDNEYEVEEEFDYEDADEDGLQEADEWDEGDEDDMEIDDVDDTDMSDSDDPFGMFADEDDAYDDYLTPQMRASLECGVLQHDAHFLVEDEPKQHAHVLSSTCHHQTADACAFLPRPVEAEGGSDGSEEVVVSHKTSISIWQLNTGQPARLMARAGTCFRHYSIAASACGNFVAASGNHGLLILFRLQRNSSSSNTTQVPAAAAAAAAAELKPSAAAPAAGSGVVLPWRLVHEATLLCKTDRETMVNSVRFGSFAGHPRLLVAHQDGMLYMFNLPGSKQAAKQQTQATAAAAAAQPGANAAAAATTVAGSELMVKGLPNWEPLGSQINRQFVEQVMGALEQQQQQQPTWLECQHGATQHQQQQQQQDRQQQTHVDMELAVQEGQQAGQMQAEPQRQGAACPAAAAAGPHARVVSPTRLTPGSVAQVEAAIASAVRMLHFVVGHLSNKCPAAAALAVQFDPKSQQQQQQHEQCSWQQRAHQLAPLLQDETFLQHLEALQQLRLAFSDLRTDMRTLHTMRDYTQAVEGLRIAAASQQALLGMLGPQQQQQQQWQRQQQQWQQQQQQGPPGSSETAGDSGSSFNAAVARAAYALLLLRLLAPCKVPQIRSSARVMVLRHGPSADASRSLTAADLRAAPRLQTTAISSIATDASAQLRITVLAAHAQQAAAAAAAQPGNHELQAAAQIAAHDAQLALGEQQHLALNICECSADGRWLAVGVDQAALLLLPAGQGYQHAAARVLDLCPALAPRPTHWESQGSLGCQYVAFNSSSTLLAATSDQLRMAAVFEVASGQLLATFTLHNRPLLPVRFVPADLNGKDGKQQQQQGSGSSSSSGVRGDRLLVYCEKDGGLHLADLSTSAALNDSLSSSSSSSSSSAHKFYLKTYLELPPPPQPAATAAAPPAAQQQLNQDQLEAEAMLDAAAAAAEPAAEQRINGLAVTPSGRVLVACQSALMELQLLRGWTRAVHARLPAKFRQSVRLLLLAASSGSSSSSSTAAAAAVEHPAQAPGTSRITSSSSSNSSTAAAQLAQLPDVVLERIIADAALPQGCWADVALPTQQQLREALSSRPGPQYDPVVEFQNAVNIALLHQQQQFVQQQQQPQI